MRRFGKLTPSQLSARGVARFGPSPKLYPGAEGAGAGSAFAQSRTYPNASIPQEIALPALDISPLGSRRFGVSDDVPYPELIGAEPRQNFTLDTPQSIRNELSYGSFQNLPFTIGTASVRVLLKPPPNTRRTYLLLVNTSAVNLLFVNFGADSSPTIGQPIMLNFGFWEFENTVPQDDIYIIAAGAGTTGVMTYCNKAIRS